MTNPLAPPPRKSVHLLPKDSLVKSLCFDGATRSLRPNLTLVDASGAVAFEINALGLKGANRDPSRQLAVIWGDSVVFGIGWSWPCLIDALAPGYQFLNGGIEADPYDNILRRAAAFNQLHTVALNVVMLGWHPIPRPPDLDIRRKSWRGLLRRLPGNRLAGDWAAGTSAVNEPELRSRLTDFLNSVPNTVLATMPTALNSRIAAADLSAQFTGGGRDTVFTFAGDAIYSVALQRYLFDYITARNRIVREVAAAQDKRLIDLAAEFDTERRADFREDFHDILHLRTRAYPKAAEAVYRGIADLL